MKNFLYVSLIVLCCVGCASKKASSTRVEAKVERAVNLANAVTRYDAQLDMRGNQMTGVLIVKPLESGSVRFAFASLFGLTMFDLEITPDSMQVNYCIDAMQKKVVLSLLEQDLRALISPSNGTTLVVESGDATEPTLVFGKGLMQGKMTLKAYEAGFPTQIAIKHKKIKIYWAMTLAEE